MRKERLEFRKAGVTTRSWVAEGRKSSRKPALGNTHWSPLESVLNRKPCVYKKMLQVPTKTKGN